MREIVRKIGKRFRCFGVGQPICNNPVAVALKDAPLQFAAGVDAATVVAFVLKESRHSDLLTACEELTTLLYQDSLRPMLSLKEYKKVKRAKTTIAEVKKGLLKNETDKESKAL